jgi:hypothetical protein
MDDRALMQMALDAFEATIGEGWSYCGPERSKAQTAFYEATLALRERLAQPEPEPVDWEAVAADQAMTIAMMTLEPKREWVGLTADEENEIAEDWWKDRLPDIHSVIKAIGAKLKERNNGC